MKTYRHVSGPPEEVILPIITASIHELRVEASRDPGTVGKVLDVGCGEQPLKQVLLDRGYSYHSCDIRQNRMGTVEFVMPIDGALPTSILDLAPFSLLLCTEVLEHVLDWSNAFRNMSQLAGSGGRVLVTCPFVYFPHERPHDYWRPTIHAINAFAERHGFRILRSLEAGSPWDVLRLILKSQIVLQRNPRPSARLSSFCLRRLCGALEHVLRSEWIKARVSMRSEFYLNTAVLMQRGP